MKRITIFLLLFASFITEAQLPISHQAGVSYTSSGSYYPAGGGATNNFLLCDYWNSGANGGWLKIDLGDTIDLESLRWWVGMVPQGNVASELVEVSLDNINWTLAANTSGVHLHLSEMKLDFATPISNVRYIRITQSGTPSWFAISELIVNEPYFADNVYTNMPPKVLDSTGKEISGAIPFLPYTLQCSKAAAYQWKLNNVNIPGATSQSYTATANGQYTCSASYTSANCGYTTVSNAPNVGSVLWLRADSAVSVTGNNVTQWNDISGSGNHVSQANTVNQPEFQNGVINGQPAIYFDGVGGIRYLNNTTDNIVPSGNARTVFVVGRMDCRAVNNGGGSFPTEGGMLLTFRRSVNLCGLMLGKTIGNNYIYTNGSNASSNAIISNSYIDTAKSPFLATYKLPGSGSPIRFRLNGDSIAVGQGAPVTVETGATGFTVGNREDIIGQDWQGWISEIIVYDYLMDSAEVAQVEGYLESRYGLDQPKLDNNCDNMLWLKADAGTTYNASNKVSSWKDISGNSNHVAQAVSANQPILKENAINGNPSMLFNGSEIFSSNTVIDWANTTKIDAFIVCKSDSSNGMLFESSTNATAQSGTFNAVDKFASTGNGVSAYAKGSTAGSRQFINSSGYMPCFNIYRISYDLTQVGSPIVKVKQNGLSLTDDNGVSTGTMTGSFTNQNLFIGGRSGLSTNPFKGEIAELIIFSRLLNGTEETSTMNYLTNKYFSGSAAIFSGLPTSQNHSNAFINDNAWKHSYNASQPSQIITSVNDNCQDLGARMDTVYLEPTAAQVGNAYYMRRHYVIKTSLNPAGTKTVRLYYSAADFADLQSAIPSLNAHNQLVVTKYNGPNEDGVFNSSGGTVSLIPSSAITTGSAYGQHYLEFDVNSFSEFWIHTGNTALPLDLISFTASKFNQHQAMLNWEIANATNVSGFEVEKSSDGVDFEQIGFVPFTQQMSFQFIDKNPDSKNYYRLRITNVDRQYQFSEIKELQFNNSDINISMYPNPASNNIFIKMISADDEKKEVLLFDLLGHLIKKVRLKPSNDLFSMSIDDLSPGIYMLKVSVGKETRQFKIFKK